MHHTNVVGTLAVIAACKAVKVSTLIYTSSIEVVCGVDQYGVTLPLTHADEAAPMAVVNNLPNAGAKAYAERLQSCALVRFDLDTSWALEHTI
jgi:nucleoside-diphosphate-sugar epimerase